MTITELQYCIDNCRHKDGDFKGAIDDALFIRAVIDSVMKTERMSKQDIVDNLDNNSEYKRSTILQILSNNYLFKPVAD